MVTAVSFERPSAPESGTSFQVAVDPGVFPCVPWRNAYSNPSAVNPAGMVQLTASELSFAPSASVGVMLGISVLTVTVLDADDAPDPDLMRICSSYSVAGDRPVTTTPFSSCALSPVSVPSATSFQVAVHAGVPVGFTRYLYCQLYSVNSRTTPLRSAHRNVTVVAA